MEDIFRICQSGKVVVKVVEFISQIPLFLSGNLFLNMDSDPPYQGCQLNVILIYEFDPSFHCFLGWLKAQVDHISFSV